MLFKRKFFLDLEAEGGKTPAPPAIVAPVATEPAPAKPAAAAPQPDASPAQAPAAPAAATAATTPAVAAAPTAAANPPSAGLTTAEAIAAELAAEQANRPAPTLATFAPECLTPGASSLRRRRVGADLARFRAMAGGILRS